MEGCRNISTAFHAENISYQLTCYSEKSCTSAFLMLRIETVITPAPPQHNINLKCTGVDMKMTVQNTPPSAPTYLSHKLNAILQSVR